MLGKEQSLSLRSFKSGLVTRLPETLIPEDAFSDVQNIELDDRFVPTKSKGQVKYNSATLGAYPIRGGGVYTKTDGTKYYIVACGGKLQYSVAGSKTYTEY